MKVTLITGASGGIGEAFARQLAKEGHHLLMVARSANKLKALSEQLTQQYKITAHYLAIDLAKSGSDQIIADEVAKRDLQVDWLINNAGIGTGGDLLEYTLDEYLNMMHLNMDAMVALTYQFLPAMRARKSGTIINVGSMAGFNGIPYMNVYAATKGFVMYFTQALWEENRLYNIQTMLLCPGATETGFFDAAKIGGERKSMFSTKKMETPEQVVTAAMKGLRKKSILTISGFQNKLMKSIAQIIPVKTALKIYGNMMRKSLNLVIK
ncbi:SDR family oxidoreductase [Chitinophaga sancti]|uniref:SDR family NAD(P)-dependent oxidoreductase n=1 Tax=Chitinophaga sancti TaxID=1004 RepID=UPI002A74A148|nr:SDR family oxidoreductase [Chitinophaga sancti]WPQ63541.1 SDR family oxidoreductase [Chitinophaga sancti]